MDQPVIESIAKLEMKPGDVLVVRSRSALDDFHAQRLADALKAELPNVTVLFLNGSDIELEVITPPAGTITAENVLKMWDRCRGQENADAPLIVE